MKRFKFALNGILLSFKSETNFKIHLPIALITATAGFVFKLNLLEWCIILLAMGVVLSLEILNTAIESLVDIVSPGYSEKAGRIKDMAAGAVFIAAMVSAIIGFIIFLPKIISHF